MSDDIQCEKSKSSFNANIKFILSKSLIGDVKSLSDDIRVEEDMVLLEADISSKKLIEDIKLRRDNNQNEKFSPKADFKWMSSNEFIEKVRSICLKLSKTDHRRAISFRSSLQSFLKQTVIAFWQQKDRLDHFSLTRTYIKKMLVLLYPKRKPMWAFSVNFSFCERCLSRAYALQSYFCYDPFGQDKVYGANSLYPKQWCSKGSKGSGPSSTPSTLSECSKDSKCSRPSSTSSTSSNQRYGGTRRVYIKTRCLLWTSCSIQIIRSQLSLQAYFKQVIRYNYLLFTSRGIVSRNPFRRSSW